MDFKKYENIPFKEKGRDFDGCDCWGLIYLFKKFEENIDVPTYTNKYLSPLEKEEIHNLVVNERLFWKEIPLGKEKFGDVINLRINGKDWHVGIVLNNKRFLHVMKSINTVIEKYTSLQWKNKIAGFYRYEC